MAFTIATCEAIYLQHFLNELSLAQPSVTLLLDNQSTMQLAHNPVHHSRTKHIDVFIHERLESGNIKLDEIHEVSARPRHPMSPQPLSVSEVNTLQRLFNLV
jgi:hypothetical protein